jgi:hypothetical protein
LHFLLVAAAEQDRNVGNKNQSGADYGAAFIIMLISLRDY